MISIDVSGDGAAVALGVNSYAGAQEIALARRGRHVTISESGILVGGDTIPSEDLPAGKRGEHVLAALRELFGDPGEFYVTTSKASLRVLMDGTVFVNGVKVGKDSTMLARAMGFFAETLVEAVQPSLATLVKFNNFLKLAGK